jgi:sialate O-acetylesterase
MLIMKLKTCFLVLILIFASEFLKAQLRIPFIFSDHMVVQQNSNFPVWGWSDINDQIIVKANWDNSEVKGVCSHVDGRWMVKLKTPHSGGPFTIEVKGPHKTIVLSDVMVGEVWLCSGQSNMEFQLPGANSGKEEIASPTHPDVRFFRIAKTAAEYPQDNCYGSWVTCNSGDMPAFSAVGYFFAKELSERLKVPIGIINSSWGGSPIEVWMRAEKISEDSLLNAQALKKDDRWSPIKPGSVFNAMINPVAFYPLAGVIWYQGESNVDQYPTYGRLMEKLISCWRNEWKTDFPFYYVQIAPYTYRNGKSAFLREQQTLSRKIPNTGMVVISDLVSDTTNIHPKDKKEVGIRLANLALSKHYAMPGITAESPFLKDMQIKGKEIQLSFTNCENGLQFKPGKVTGFEIAGSDGHFYQANVKLKVNLVIVSSKEVSNPVSVHYCFSDAALPTLFSKEGLPVGSFRTGL